MSIGNAVKSRRINIKLEYLYVKKGMRISDYVLHPLLIYSA